MGLGREVPWAAPNCRGVVRVADRALREQSAPRRSNKKVIRKCRLALLATFAWAIGVSAFAADGPDYASLARQLPQVRDILQTPALAAPLRRMMGGGAYNLVRPMLEQGTAPFTDVDGVVEGMACLPGTNEQCARIVLDGQSHVYVAVQDRDITTFYGDPPAEIFPQLFAAERADGAMELGCDGGPAVELLYKDEPTASSVGENLVMVVRSQARYVAMTRTGGSATAPIAFNNRNGYRLIWYTDTSPYQLVIPGRPVRSCQYD